MLKDFVTKIKNKINEANKNYEEYQKQLVTASKIEGLLPLPTEINSNKRIDPESIVSICPDLNAEKAKLILNVLPINELFLAILYSKEIKTGTEYYLVPTTTCLWIINQNGYIKYSYESLTMQIVKGGLMCKIVNLSNFLLDVTGDKVEYLLNIITNQEFRNQEIQNKNNSLCGINPTIRIINSIGSGISLDDNKNIVFHTKEFSKKYHISELENYELFLDNNVIIEKKTKMQVRITAGKTSCYEMKIKITPKTQESFIIPILPRSVFEKMYLNTNESYMNSFKFARELIDILDDLNEKNLNGY